jgi:hypothetical protein
MPRYLHVVRPDPEGPNLYDALTDARTQIRQARALAGDRPLADLQADPHYLAVHRAANEAMQAYKAANGATYQVRSSRSLEKIIRDIERAESTGDYSALPEDLACFLDYAADHGGIFTS